jgi:hypothetical protein
MGQSEHHGVKGKLHLQRNWTESSSTHLETFDDLWLEQGEDDSAVTLVRAHGDKNFIKTSGGDYREDRYVISVEKLSSLIKQHGKKI